MNANATDLNKEIKLNTLRWFHNVCLRGLQHLIPHVLTTAIQSTA